MGLHAVERVERSHSINPIAIHGFLLHEIPMSLETKAGDELGTCAMLRCRHMGDMEDPTGLAARSSIRAETVLLSIRQCFEVYMSACCWSGCYWS